MAARPWVAPIGQDGAPPTVNAQAPTPCDDPTATPSSVPRVRGGGARLLGDGQRGAGGGAAPTAAWGWYYCAEATLAVWPPTTPSNPDDHRARLRAADAAHDHGRKYIHDGVIRVPVLASDQTAAAQAGAARWEPIVPDCFEYRTPLEAMRAHARGIAEFPNFAAGVPLVQPTQSGSQHACVGEPAPLQGAGGVRAVGDAGAAAPTRMRFRGVHWKLHADVLTSAFTLPGMVLNAGSVTNPDGAGNLADVLKQCSVMLWAMHTEPPGDAPRPAPPSASTFLLGGRPKTDPPPILQPNNGCSNLPITANRATCEAKCASNAACNYFYYKPAGGPPARCCLKGGPYDASTPYDANDDGGFYKLTAHGPPAPAPLQIPIDGVCTSTYGKMVAGTWKPAGTAAVSTFLVPGMSANIVPGVVAHIDIAKLIAYNPPPVDLADVLATKTDESSATQFDMASKVTAAVVRLCTDWSGTTRHVLEPAVGAEPGQPTLRPLPPVDDPAEALGYIAQVIALEATLANLVIDWKSTQQRLTHVVTDAFTGNVYAMTADAARACVLGLYACGDILTVGGGAAYAVEPCLIYNCSANVAVQAAETPDVLVAGARPLGTDIVNMTSNIQVDGASATLPASATIVVTANGHAVSEVTSTVPCAPVGTSFTGEVVTIGTDQYKLALSDYAKPTITKLAAAAGRPCQGVGGGAEPSAAPGDVDAFSGGIAMVAGLTEIGIGLTLGDNSSTLQRADGGAEPVLSVVTSHADAGGTHTVVATSPDARFVNPNGTVEVERLVAGTSDAVEAFSAFAAPAVTMTMPATYSGWEDGDSGPLALGTLTYGESNVGYDADTNLCGQTSAKVGQPDTYKTVAECAEAQPKAANYGQFQPDKPQLPLRKPAGAAGKDGRAGSAGKDGRPGAAGKDGRPGPAGKPGGIDGSAKAGIAIVAVVGAGLAYYAGRARHPPPAPAYHAPLGHGAPAYHNPAAVAAAPLGHGAPAAAPAVARPAP